MAAEIIETDVLSERFELNIRRLGTLKNEVDLASSKDLKEEGIQKQARLLRAAAIAINSMVEAAHED